VARLGGDEFAILLAPSTADEADAAAARVVEALSQPIEADGRALLVGASVGVASLEGGPMETAELIRRADVAMYAAKSAGKRRAARFRPEMDAHSAADARLGADLRQALDDGELTVHFQPFVTLPDGRITGAEALVRWGSLPPSVFIPVAERTGTILALGEWVLREACTQAAAMRRLPGGEQLHRISVNVSARQLREPDFAERVAAIVAETGIEVEMLIVEVTETAVFDGGAALESVHALHRAGIAIALDDFGTGHSSLGLLRTCPVDILKVDKSFVDGIGSSAGQEAVIATALIRIAEGLGLQAVAEGVETAAQADRLHELGYQFAQGYHFARPMPASELAALLAAQLVTAAE
jgi:predicted signal transduction protein with EAL and GGDEF domain